jgi:hypothetical protein
MQDADDTAQIGMDFYSKQAHEALRMGIVTMSLLAERGQIDDFATISNLSIDVLGLCDACSPQKTAGQESLRIMSISLLQNCHGVLTQDHVPFEKRPYRERSYLIGMVDLLKKFGEPLPAGSLRHSSATANPDPT